MTKQNKNKKTHTGRVIAFQNKQKIYTAAAAASRILLFVFQAKKKVKNG